MNTIKQKLAPIGISLLGVAMVGGALFAGIAHASTEPVISSISAAPTSTGATITWMTDENANAQVLYGTSTPYTASTTPTSGFSTTTQSVALTGLTPSTTYFYAVVSSDASNNTNSSTEQEFMTTGTPATTTPTNTTGTLTTNIATGTPGTVFTVNGSGFGNAESVNVNFDGSTSTVGTNASGTFSTALTVPTTTVSTDTIETIMAAGVTSGNTASTTFTIVPAIVVPSSSISLSPTSGMPGTSFTVTGANFGVSEPITLSFNGATSSANADMNGAFTADIAIPSSTATTGNVTVTATGVTSGDTASATFDLLPATPTSTVTSSTITMLQNEIAQLQAIVAQLVSEVQSLLNGNGSGTGSGSGGGFPTSTLQATIDSVGPVRVGTSVDFTGRNWADNEQVQISTNGNVVTTAQADGGGNFSTGSLSVGNTPGTQAYTFTGKTSGITRTVNVTVTQ